MKNFNQGDIVLLPYPYTDLSRSKRRPVVIISKDSINRQNFIVAKITSVIRNDELSFTINQNETDIKLRKNSEVRTNELFTVHHSLIIKKITHFKKNALQRLTTQIKENISVTP
jgi:mRNA interferase MazF